MINFRTHFSATFFSFLLVAASLLATSCKKVKPAMVNGTVDGLGTQNISMIYDDGNGTQTMVVTAVDGKFDFSLNLPSPAVLELYNSSRSFLGVIVVEDNQKLNVGFKAGRIGPLSASGNELTESLASFIAANNKNNNDTLFNEAIERQVEKSPASALSALLMTYYYNPSIADAARADSLMRLIDFEDVGFTIASGHGRAQMVAMANAPQMLLDTLCLPLASGDSLRHITFANHRLTLIHFFDSKSTLDNIAAALDTLTNKQLQLVVVRMSPDTIGLARLLDVLPKRVERLWAPGGIADPAISPLVLPTLPYTILVDSAGAQTLRSPNFPEAVDQLLK